MLQVCYQVNSSDPLVAAEALAAAGVIRAHDGEIYDPIAQLTEIVQQSERRSLLWKFPENTGSVLEAILADTILSTTWRDVTARYVKGGGCRLRVLPDSLSPSDCFEAVKTLLQSGEEAYGAADPTYPGNPDWRYVPSETIASVTVYLPTSSAGHIWQWPMQINCDDMPIIEDTQETFARGLATLSREPLAIPPPDLFIQKIDAPTDNLFSGSVLSGLKLFVSDPDASDVVSAPPRLWDMLTQPRSAPMRPEALLSAHYSVLPDFLRDYVYALSHNAPPDVALFDAWFRIRPRPTAPLLLMAPSIGFDDDMENARLNSRVAETLDRLGRVLAQSEQSRGPLQIDITPTLADAFGLPSSVTNVALAEVYPLLVRNLLTGRIRFDNESDAGENLNALNAETDRLVRDLEAPKIHFLHRGMGYEMLSDLDLAKRTPGDGDSAEKDPPEPFEEETFLKPSPATPVETDRYIDPVFYYGHFAAGDEPDATEIVRDDEALEEESPYTLEIAIRAKRIGIDRTTEAPATITPPREAQEAVTVYARVESLDEKLLRFEDGFLPLTWPFDEDSTPAFFRCQTGRGPRGRNFVDLEVLIYSEELHLLEVMTIRDVVIGTNAEGRSRHKHWPEDRPTALQPPVGEEPVSLSLRIKGAPMGFTAEAIFRVGPDRLRPIPLGRTILADDIRALLVQIRDFWTELVVGDLNFKEKLLKYKYKKCLDQMWGFGGSAWRLFFGNDRDTGAAALGDLIRAVDLAKDSLIQVTCREDARHFVFPWALMRPDPAPPGYADPDAFWGLRFLVEQTNRKGARNLRLSDTPVRVAAVIDPGFAGVVPHQDTLTRGVETDGWGKLHPLITDADLKTSLSGPAPAQLYYFFCQGFTPGENPHLAADHIKTLRDLVAASGTRQVWDTLLNRLSTPPGEATMFFGTASMSETELSDIDFFQGRSRPIIFLNMCHSADLLPAMGHGITRRFIERNASAVVGTECPMTAVFADLFAGKVLEQLAEHKTIGHAILSTRRHFHEARNPLGFAYTLYGRSDARLGPDPNAQPFSTAITTAKTN